MWLATSRTWWQTGPRKNVSLSCCQKAIVQCTMLFSTSVLAGRKYAVARLCWLLLCDGMCSSQ